MGLWTKPFCLFAPSFVFLFLIGCPSTVPQSKANSTSNNTPQANNAQANEIAESLDIPLDIAIPLFKLHKRFGHLDTTKLATSGLIVGLMSDDWHDYMRESIQVTQAALNSSNAEINLGAPPKPTGDKLFDLYAIEVFSQIESLPWAEVTSDEAMYAAALPDYVVAAWEQQFSNDPKYWELRYFCAMFFPGDNPLAGDFEERIDFLRRSQESGVANANTLMLLYEEVMLEKREEAGELELGGFKPNDEALAILGEAIATWPDECWPWYYRALHNYRSGKMELALADLKQGINAVINVYPRPYPFSFVEKHFGGKSPSGSALVSGAILLTAQPYRLPNLIEWKEFQQKSLNGINDPPGIKLLNDWQSFACNLAQSDQIDLIFSMAGLVMVGNNQNFMRTTQLVDLAEKQYEVLWRESGANETILDQIRESGSASIAVDGATALGMAGGVKGIPVAWYLGAEMGFVFQEINSSRFDDLRTVDYTTMAMPDALLKYEALTPEDIEQRKAERRARIAEEEN